MPIYKEEMQDGRRSAVGNEEKEKGCNEHVTRMENDKLKNCIQ